MAKSDTFNCTVITPEAAVLDCDATSVAFPAHDGEMGILNHRAPLICRMGIGTLRIEGPDGPHRFFVDGGFAQVVENRLTLLTEQAKTIDELDGEKAAEALVEAKAMKITDDTSYTARDRALQRAQVQLKLVKRG